MLVGAHRFSSQIVSFGQVVHSRALIYSYHALRNLNAKVFIQPTTTGRLQSECCYSCLPQSLASPEESLTLGTPVLSIPEFPQSEPKVVDTRRCLPNIPPNPELAPKSNTRKYGHNFFETAISLTGFLDVLLFCGQMY